LPVLEQRLPGRRPDRPGGQLVADPAGDADRGRPADLPAEGHRLLGPGHQLRPGAALLTTTAYHHRPAAWGDPAAGRFISAAAPAHPHHFSQLLAPSVRRPTICSLPSAAVRLSPTPMIRASPLAGPTVGCDFC